jgi:hypothetical protein
MKVELSKFVQFASFSLKLILFKKSRLISKSAISSISRLMKLLLPKFLKSNEVSFSNKQKSLKVSSQINISLIPALHVCSREVLTKLLLLFTGKQTVKSESELSLSCAPRHP